MIWKLFEFLLISILYKIVNLKSKYSRKFYDTQNKWLQEIYGRDLSTRPFPLSYHHICFLIKILLPLNRSSSNFICPNLGFSNNRFMLCFRFVWNMNWNSKMQMEKFETNWKWLFKIVKMAQKTLKITEMCAK